MSRGPWEPGKNIRVGFRETAKIHLHAFIMLFQEIGQKITPHSIPGNLVTWRAKTVVDNPYLAA